MENDFSAIKSIQELKNLLDSGAITQQEYEVLKRKIIFGNSASTSDAGSNPATGPLRPPVAPGTGENRNLVPPPPVRETGPFLSKENNPVVPEHRRESNVLPVPPPAPAKVPKEPINLLYEYSQLNQPENEKAEKSRDWLLTTLISLAAVLLIGLVAYWLLSDKESERLTSTSGPDTEETRPATVTEQNTGTVPDATPTESTSPDRIATNTVPENVPAPTNTPEKETAVVPANENNRPTETTATAQAPAAQPDPAPVPRISNEEAVNKIKDRLQSYYTDFQTAPFAAQNHFAPNVERYYTLTGTNPQAINENINNYHYPEFQDSQSAIEDGTLKLVGNSENGYEVTYIEHGKAFRKSKGQRQETTARVRARFDKDFKITYFRQEQLLENKFIEE